MTAAMSVVPTGGWLVGLVLYVAASIGFATGNSLYDSLLPSISTPDDVDEISATGFGLGYLGGALLFAFNVWMISDPGAFSLPDATVAVRIGFLSVAVWWGAYSVCPSSYGSTSPIRLAASRPAHHGSRPVSCGSHKLPVNCASIEDWSSS